VFCFFVIHLASLILLMARIRVTHYTRTMLISLARSCSTRGYRSQVILMVDVARKVDLLVLTTFHFSLLPDHSKAITSELLRTSHNLTRAAGIFSSSDQNGYQISESNTHHLFSLTCSRRGVIQTTHVLLLLTPPSLYKRYFTRFLRLSSTPLDCYYNFGVTQYQFSQSSTATIVSLKPSTKQSCNLAVHFYLRRLQPADAHAHHLPNRLPRGDPKSQFNTRSHKLGAVSHFTAPILYISRPYLALQPTT
jgi:hypothetical protein